MSSTLDQKANDLDLKAPSLNSVCYCRILYLSSLALLRLHITTRSWRCSSLLWHNYFVLLTTLSSSFPTFPKPSLQHFIAHIWNLYHALYYVFILVVWHSLWVETIYYCSWFTGKGEQKYDKVFYLSCLLTFKWINNSSARSQSTNCK